MKRLLLLLPLLTSFAVMATALNPEIIAAKLKAQAKESFTYGSNIFDGFKSHDLFDDLEVPPMAGMIFEAFIGGNHFGVGEGGEINSFLDSEIFTAIFNEGSVVRRSDREIEFRLGVPFCTEIKNVISRGNADWCEPFIQQNEVTVLVAEVGENLKLSMDFKASGQSAKKSVYGLDLRSSAFTQSLDLAVLSEMQAEKASAEASMSIEEDVSMSGIIDLFVSYEKGQIKSECTSGVGACMSISIRGDLLLGENSSRLAVSPSVNGQEKLFFVDVISNDEVYIGINAQSIYAGETDDSGVFIDIPALNLASRIHLANKTITVNRFSLADSIKLSLFDTFITAKLDFVKENRPAVFSFGENKGTLVAPLIDAVISGRNSGTKANLSLDFRPNIDGENVSMEFFPSEADEAHDGHEAISKEMLSKSQCAKNSFLKLISGVAKVALSMESDSGREEENISLSIEMQNNDSLHFGG